VTSAKADKPSRFLHVVVLVHALIVMGACTIFPENRAAVHFRQGNEFYQQQDYTRAAEEYEKALQLDPNLTPAYFFLGSSYENQYNPSKRGESGNDALLAKAVHNYSKAAEVEQDPKIKKLALEYLVEAYGPDKLNDPAQAGPAVQRMIELDPKNPLNYFALAKIYEDEGDYKRAEATLIEARQARPSDPSVYLQLTLYYGRRGNFDKTIEALEARAQVEPNNPETYYTMAMHYWDRAYRGIRLPEEDKRRYVEAGVAAVDHAIALNSEYVEALVYKGLLLRLEADLEKNPARQKALVEEADELRDRAQELRKQRAAGSIQ
jgi:tetratricopeptide (TPR) repeat protein